MSSPRSRIVILRLLPIVGHRVQYRRRLVENVDRPSKLHGKVWHHHGTSANPRFALCFLAMSRHGSVTVLTAPWNSHFLGRIQVIGRVGHASPHSIGAKLIYIVQVTVRCIRDCRHGWAWLGPLGAGFPLLRGAVIVPPTRIPADLKAQKRETLNSASGPTRRSWLEWW